MEPRVIGDRRAGSGDGFRKLFTPQIVLTLGSIVFAAGILYAKVEAAERRLDRIEEIVFGRSQKSASLLDIFDFPAMAGAAGSDAGAAAVDRSFCNSALLQEGNFMTPQERFNQVLIVDEPQEPKDALDAHGREINHTVLIIRKGDDAVLGKYRAKEVRQERDSKGALVEKTITGRRAAELACEANGWKIARN